MQTEVRHVAGVSLPPHETRRWTRYVAMGDSLTEGVGDPLPDGALRGWATLLADHLSNVAPGLEFINLAVRGHRAGDALRRQLPAAVALRPDLVSVVVGANDVMLNPWLDRRRFALQLDRLIDPFAPQGITVVLSTLPDLAALSTLPPPLRGELRRRIQVVNEITRATADRCHAVLYDAWADPRTRRRTTFSVDRIHPNAEGHRLIAASVAELLGVPVAPHGDGLVRSSPAALLGRYAREAAWLLRHGPTSTSGMA